MPGDGVGPEVIAASQAVLGAVSERFDLSVQTETILIGGSAINA